VEVRDTTITPTTSDPDANLIGRYWYDGDGKRVKKYAPPRGSNPGETTVFVYDAGGKQIAEYSTAVAAQTQAKVAYLTSDHLGSPRINTDASGAVISRHDYHPFGEEISTQQRINHPEYAGDQVRKQFTAYERDVESNLDFAQARMYGYGFGRFTSPDDFLNDTHVSDPQSWNLYVYVRNNPLRLIDPSGEIILNSDGTVKFDPDKVDKKTGKGKDSDFIYQQVEQKDGSIITYKWKAIKGSIYTDNGKKVEAFKATTAVSAEVQRADGTIDKKQSQTLTAALSKADNSADCHGNTFAGGQVWINNDQVKTIIENDGYRPLADGEKPQQGDVGIYAEGKKFKLENTQHSVLVNTVSSDGQVTDVVSKGGITTRAILPTGPGPRTAWDSANNQNDKKNTQLQYFTKRVTQ
jgi:RHS repeat-associated protein